jgi:hypothetical protein
MRHFYLRDRDTLFPVACIATERQTNDTKIAYALSVFHEGDDMDIRIARRIARGRLEEYIKGRYDQKNEGWAKFGVVVLEDPKSNAKVKLLATVAADPEVPSVARKAAKEWLKNMTGTPEQQAVQRKLDKECRIINGTLQVQDWWRAKAVALQMELDELVKAVA